MNEIEALRQAKKIIEGANFPNVRGVSIGYKRVDGKKTRELAILVFVKKKVIEKKLSASSMIPRTIMIDREVKTDVIQSGEFKIRSLTGKVRPLVPGYSIGHPDITTGTLGCFVSRDDRVYILSNNHVLANVNKAEIGDPIIQPGTYDGGTYGDRVAMLSDFVKIEMLQTTCSFTNGVVSCFNFFANLFGKNSRLTAINSASNLVDCAIAEVDAGYVLSVPQIGIPTGIVEGELDMKIRKLGRTTEYTEDEIIGIESSVMVNMGDGQLALFTDQLIADEMSAGGDSGSAVFDNGTNLVGLLFAGGDGTTIINRIQNVFEELDIKLP